MSLGQKLSRAFRKVAASGAFVALSVPLSIGAGVYTINQIDHPYAAKAPVENVALHQAAVQKMQAMGADFVALDAKIEFNQRTLDRAKEKGVDAATLQQGYAALDKDKQAEKDQLAAYRRELLLNPTLSERDAADLYNDLVYVANDKADNAIWDNISHLGGPLAYRDETKAALGLPADPAKVSPEMATRLLDRSTALAKHNLREDEGGGLAAAGGLFGGLLGLSLLARRKNEREEEEEYARQKAARKRPSPPPPRPRDPPAEQPAVEKKPAHKLSL